MKIHIQIISTHIYQRKVIKQYEYV